MADCVWILSLTGNVNAEGSSRVPEEGHVMNGQWAYSGFEKAKSDMLRLIRAYAKSDNGLFDGEGNIVGFREYFHNIREENCFSEEPRNEKEASFFKAMAELHGGYDDTEASFRQIESVPALLREWLTEAPGFTPDTIPDAAFTDHSLGCKASPEQIFVEGVDDGPCNGTDPYILINTFRMDDPDREYNFRVRNTFEDRFDEPERFVYIDLMKVEVDAEFEY